jgi:hypothetical protein
LALPTLIAFDHPKTFVPLCGPTCFLGLCKKRSSTAAWRVKQAKKHTPSGMPASRVRYEPKDF